MWRGWLSGGVRAFAARPRVPEEQYHGEAKRQDAADEEVSPDGPADKKRGVDTEGLDEEATERVEAHIEHEDIAGLQALREAAGDPQQDQADYKVPDGLVEEGRVEGRGVRIPDWPVLGRDADGPRQ